jgi:hypothetical protein
MDGVLGKQLTYRRTTARVWHACGLGYAGGHVPVGFQRRTPRGPLAHQRAGDCPPRVDGLLWLRLGDALRDLAGHVEQHRGPSARATRLRERRPDLVGPRPRGCPRRRLAGAAVDAPEDNDQVIEAHGAAPRGRIGYCAALDLLTKAVRIPQRSAGARCPNISMFPRHGSVDGSQLRLGVAPASTMLRTHADR